MVPVPVAGPGTLDAVSLLAEVADELVLGTVRDTHLAWLERVHARLAPVSGPGEAVHHVVHRSLASAVYGGVGLGLSGTSHGLRWLGRTRIAQAGDPRLANSARGRAVLSAVYGLIGDRLAAERPEWALPLSLRREGREVGLDSDSLAEAFPDASGCLVVFMHGLCEDESCWDWKSDRRGPGYPQALEERDWTPLLLRANTGLPVQVNGVALAALLQQVVDDWPVPVERVVLVGHSMGGLVMRAAAAVLSEVDAPWKDLVTDVVTLATPHLGAPLADGVGRGSTHLARLPETSALGRLLDWRSSGVHDLVEGLGADVPALPQARYRLVSGSLTTSPRHPVGGWFGDLLVRQPSAYGESRGRPPLFPGADLLHVPRAGHFDLLNHPRVHDALATWLG